VGISKHATQASTADSPRFLVSLIKEFEKESPLLPSQDHYMYNLVALKSSDAKRMHKEAIVKAFNCKCVYCGTKYESKDLTIDHVRPRCFGGQSFTSNLVPSCRRCNQAKGSRNWLEWMRETFGITERERDIMQHIGGQFA